MTTEAAPRRIKPSDPIVTRHGINRLRERFEAGRGLTDAAAADAIRALLRRGERWGCSSPGSWHVLADFGGEPVVLAMVTALDGGRPLVRTVLTLNQAIANQRRAVV